ncbi:MAG: septal ring lytic transglycosylase RlpA family protein [Hoeflea sp.]|uniref:septal ring lytic transglycosylase RlpA family protein n=1 Tax=Hoeflea sp. TaxID=1940281 RepID=UPI00272FCBC5|nr:septal ring lytic transglycosylase RlpA family protein [Hoeflea sp.]MDP2121468.1 septal ring lytic transglycosylase RlpA family protein [Hoeflea sp.]MDP3526632.1 septal ring lytic transglycosylase RlpA family protein [Hoeflea sp.]MDZ7602283.1 septal ring lytic transglycosylase RlpA family protein [Hoeflea sp.]
MNFNKTRSCASALIVSSILAVSAASPAAAADPSCGRASWYALTSKTASGERMDPSKLTAAHPRLRFGTRVEVTNPRNGKTVVVRINDRGPFVKNRIIDVSKAAAGQLGMINAGVAKVCFRVVS